MPMVPLQPESRSRRAGDHPAGEQLSDCDH
jgi:hypothetical protein